MGNITVKYYTVITISSIIVILSGIYVLVLDYLLQNKYFSPNEIGNLPMAPDAAICLLLAGSSLFLQAHQRQILHKISKLLAVLLSLLGILSLIRHLPGLYNNLIFAHLRLEMAPQSAYCFALCGIVFFALRIHKMRYFIQLLLHCITLIASIVIIGHILKLPHFYNMTFTMAMSVYTAIALIILSVAASFFNWKVGITGMLTGKYIGNLMARRVITRLLLTFVASSGLLIMCLREKWVNAEFAIALYIITYVIITIVVLYQTTSVLNHVDRVKEIAKENFRSVVESAPNALIISDIKGNIALVNNHAKKIFGYTADEMVGQKLELIVPERFHSAHKQKQPLYFKNPKPRSFGANLDLYAKRKNGEEFPIEINITPIITKEGTVALASIIDITERKQNEEIIKKQLEELQSKNQELEQFNYISSHDLQEPLRTVLNYVQMLEEDYPELDEDVKNHHNAIKDAVVRMSMVVKSLLEFGRLGKQKALVITDVKKVINDVLADLNRLIEASGAKVEVVCDLPQIMAYETQLRQLFQNLIANAIKFRKENIIPQISICANSTKGYYEFSVTDNGIGIDPKHHEKIFHIFQRLNKDEEYEGHGIGLANVKKIVEMHGGKIWVESTPGEGSIFKFTILNFKP
jgi:PAS domain S-box-containing protein